MLFQKLTDSEVLIALVIGFALAVAVAIVWRNRFLALKASVTTENQNLEGERKSAAEAASESIVKIGDLAGGGSRSGGYIVIEMSERERPLFHDLLKGFEDYAKLKGYEISFSIDSSFEGRIAFKFTVKNDGVTVGPERVRKDFAEYVKQVRTGKLEDLDDMPVVTSIEEHNLLMAMLKNRIVFLQQNYSLAKNAQTYYESILSNVRTFP